MEYRKVYDDFIASYIAGTTNAEEVGHTITIMAQHFCDANMAVGAADKGYSTLFAENMQLEEGGKSISAAKAKIMTDASEEANVLSSAKRNLENIEQLINALKYLQRGMANEYQHMN